MSFFIRCDSSLLFHASLVLPAMPVQDPLFFLSLAKVQESLRPLMWKTRAFCYLCLKKWLCLSLLFLGRFSQIIQHGAKKATVCHCLPHHWINVGIAKIIVTADWAIATAYHWWKKQIFFPCSFPCSSFLFNPGREGVGKEKWDLPPYADPICHFNSPHLEELLL